MRAQKQRPFHRSYKAGAVANIANAAFAWCQSLLTIAGLAHLLCVTCFVVQVILIDYFLVQYLSATVLLTLIVDVPVLLHLAWFWRVEVAHRAAPTQWFCYCWVHAAKVVVLFCRVMPRLTSATPTKDGLHGSDFSINSAYFEDLYSPTMLANLLLITPVFYSLLMFRTSKAIFGSLSKRVTVDLIMHYDMLWRVVIDMVDQVDMFYYARLAEWVGKEALEKHRPSLVLIQTVVPFLLFFSMVLQAQAFPGVVTDKWPIPVEASATLPQACSEPREEPSRSDAQMQAVSNAQRYALQPQAPLSQLQAAAASSAPSSVPPRRAEDWQSETSGARQAVTFAADLRGGMPSSGDTFSDRQSSGSGIMLRKSTGFGPGRERAWLERHERARRRRLQAIINLIQRQNVIIARKRSAIASIFLIDIPFLTIRVWLWALLQHTYFPGLGVKNGLCIVLNVMQYTLVALASKESFKRIKRELAEYLCRFQGSALKEEEEEEEEIGHDSPDHNALDEGEVMSPQEPGTPDKQAAKDLPEVLQTSTSQAEMKRALRRVGRESTRSVGACVYICALTMALVLGFVIAQGETVIETFVAWAKEATAVE
mmetsp:Transcript_62085/g.147948  ORF Transcript_62085/g.147948 Transcript_62085/m.147948 type:complete len:596 (-) Transcript_62085:53-1840(-)